MRRIFYAFIISVVGISTLSAQKLSTPDRIYGVLFEDVQMQRIFPDNKTFVDAVPKRSPQLIVADYEREKTKKNFVLSQFVENNFEIPQIKASNYVSDRNQSINEHIAQLWTVLKRDPDQSIEGSSRLPLPHSYIVPGGRFQEIYYWDTYFTMLGLEADNRIDQIEDIVNNFEYIILTYGHIPNGSRSYYLSRSQPPYFAQMVQMLANIKKDDNVYVRYNKALQAEYNYFMDRSANTQHVVSMPDGSFLNRYWDQSDRPRQESFCEDSTLAIGNADPAHLYRELRSGAESGWDFSSRWLTNANDLSTIRCTDMVAVDLNALLVGLEQVLAKSYEQMEDMNKAEKYNQLANDRIDAINTYCYNPADGWYYDYIISEGRCSDVKTLAGMMPFYMNIAPVEYIDKAANIVNNHFLRPGGVVTTANRSGQQWDAPNGWAPLQWITIKGLDQYGKKDQARDIAVRWVDLNNKVYQATGKLMEKYNVEDIGLIAGGGEYPAQDGFGWTNGVTKRLIDEYKLELK